MSFWQDYLSVQFDPAHLLSELGFELFQFALVALLWSKHIKPRLSRRHQEFDVEHGLVHVQVRPVPEVGEAVDPTDDRTLEEVR